MTSVPNIDEASLAPRGTAAQPPGWSRRADDFDSCRKALKAVTVASSERFIVACGDARQVLARLPEGVVSLIATDPPYHATKKHNIVGDRQFASDEEYVAWVRGCAEEWYRVLRSNGSLYMFCASKLAARLEVSLSARFNALSHIAWSKPNDPGFDGWKGKMSKQALRAWYPHSERILFFEPACDGNLKRSTFGTFLRDARNEAGLTAKDLAEITESYGKVNHGGAVSNWETGRNIPSAEQYSRIIAALSLRLPDKKYPDYEDVVRPFMVHADMQFTDVWDDPSVRPYRDKHPAEKPVELLNRIICASSFPGDLVLDCFSGSGVSGVASLRNHRRALLIDIDSRWCETAAERLSSLEISQSPDSSLRSVSRRPRHQLGLEI